MHMQRIEKKNSLKYVYIYINCAFLEIDRNYFPVSLIFSFQPSTCKYTKLHSWNKRFQSRDSIVSYYWRKIQLSPPLLRVVCRPRYQSLLRTSGHEQSASPFRKGKMRLSIRALRDRDSFVLLLENQSTLNLYFSLSLSLFVWCINFFYKLLYFRQLCAVMITIDIYKYIHLSIEKKIWLS